ncbi:MAG: glycosyltransferase [Dysgonamonadaceae bacterium]|jgi:glycosyltransferase involved in cell wall biosynthesis|nr:glycosyltransferase [Dysgonamonadaceae bacterium]
MNHNPKISVLMSVYNNDRYLKEAVDSILNQTFADFELLVADDASTDTSATILAQYDDPRIQVITNENNRGLTHNLNVLLSQSRGKYIARMDADDVALPQRFRRQYDYLEAHPETGICGGFVEAFFEGSDKKQLVRYAVDDAEIRAFAFFQSPFCHPTVMIRKQVLTNHGLLYPPEYRAGQDYALWIELLPFTKGYNLPEALLRFRKHAASISSLNEQKLEQKFALIDGIHQRYLAQYGISLPENELRIYSQFTDRSIPSDLKTATQTKVSEILKAMENQIGQKYPELHSPWIYHLSMICFYNFFRAKKFPATAFLRKKYIRGFCIYLQKLISDSFKLKKQSK